MNGKKKIVIICGTGIATSTVVATKIEEICKKHRIPAQIIQGKAVEARSLAEGADLVVSTIPTLKLNSDTPVLIGIPFLNGIGEEKLENSIVNVLSK